MQCPNCGHTARGRTRFCARCGQPLPWDDLHAATSLPRPIPPPYTPPTENPNADKPSGWGTPYGPPGQYPPPNPHAPPGAAYPAYPGYPAYLAPRTNGMAVASLVLGVLGWLPCAVGSILAIVFGAIAQNQIKAAAGREGGAGLARAGLILGCIGVGLWVTYFVVVLLVTAGSHGG